MVNWKYMKFCRECEEIRECYAKNSTKCIDCADRGQALSIINMKKRHFHNHKAKCNKPGIGDYCSFYIYFGCANCKFN